MGALRAKCVARAEPHITVPEIARPPAGHHNRLIVLYVFRQRSTIIRSATMIVHSISQARRKQVQPILSVGPGRFYERWR